MSSTGIDYGLGRSNIDNVTGIRFGVISQHSIMPEACEDFEQDYGKPTCPECGRDLIDSSDDSISAADWNAGKDYACAKCEQVYWSDSVFSEESLGFTYSRAGYELTNCL